MNTPPQVIAGGNINVSRFVKPSTAADMTVLQCGANEQAIGVAYEGNNSPPTPDLATSYAAIAGAPLRIYGPGDICQVVAGSGGVTRGGRVKSDADGKAVPIATTGTTIQQIAGWALETAAENELFRIMLHPYSERPALT